MIALTIHIEMEINVIIVMNIAKFVLDRTKINVKYVNKDILWMAHRVLLHAQFSLILCKIDVLSHVIQNNTFLIMSALIIVVS